MDQGEEETLYAHILFQIRGMELESSIRESVIFLAESLDRSGWLDESLETLAEDSGLPLSDLEEGLHRLQVWSLRVWERAICRSACASSSGGSIPETCLPCGSPRNVWSRWHAMSTA